MSKPLINRDKYDHPEHFDDEIREYRSSKRYYPTPLENHLYELSSHRCTICHAPWLEIHHIDELSEGGETTYKNLIVLCPNCHTRVHIEGKPSKAELHHYKLKQEIAYELPVLSRLTLVEKKFIADVAQIHHADQLVYSKSEYQEIKASNQDEAIEIARKHIGYLYLQEFGMVSVDLEHAITLASKEDVGVALRIRLTGKGVKWVRYLRESDMFSLVV